ncbi:MAG: hypothetical protein M1519_06485 [Actinobacteria bacterium]|nr:hypothetical protein [Actinomycetota bacterium]
MSSAHKAALAQGREEGRAIRRYLEALEANRPKRGRKRTAESVRKQLENVNRRLDTSDALRKLHLLQQRRDLELELERIEKTSDLQELEEEFIKAAKAYGERKGITYAAWREAGVDASLLKRAGITRSK